IPKQGWWNETWSLVQEAALISKDDPNNRLRSEAIATLAGMEARIEKEFVSRRDFAEDASAVAFSPDGERLLLGGGNDRFGQALLPARLWNRRTSTLQTSKQIGAGPVAFSDAGRPLQVVPRPSPRAPHQAPDFLVWDVAENLQLSVCRFGKSLPITSLV